MRDAAVLVVWAAARCCAGARLRAGRSRRRHDAALDLALPALGRRDLVRQRLLHDAAEPRRPGARTARRRSATQRRFRTGSFSLSGSGGALYYPEIEGFTPADLRRSARPRLVVRRAARSSARPDLQPLQHPRACEPLDAAGLPLPGRAAADVRLDSATTSLSLQQQPVAALAVRPGRLASPGATTTTSGLTGGEQVDGSAQLGRTLGKHELDLPGLRLLVELVRRGRDARRTRRCSACSRQVDTG